MTMRHVRQSAGAVAFVLVATSLASLYEWTDFTGSHDDDSADNWYCSSCLGGYPSTVNDIAKIPDDDREYDTDPWEIELVEEEIEELRIEEDVKFTPKTGVEDPVLECDEVIISAGDDPVQASVSIVGSNGAKISTS